MKDITPLIKATKEFWLAMILLQTLFILIILSGASPEKVDILCVEVAFIIMAAIFARQSKKEGHD